MSIARGYEPVAKLDTNIMASRQALSKMGFPTSEIDKIDKVAKERKHFEKRSKELNKLSKKANEIDQKIIQTQFIEAFEMMKKRLGKKTLDKEEFHKLKEEFYGKGY